MSGSVNENLYATIANNFERDDYPDILEEIEKYAKMTPEESKATAKKQLDELENVTLNIAVTGESGVGKPTFINALRGLEDGDKGAARTGVTETTMEPIRYCHPAFPSVYFWDLPGIRTPKFKAKNYLKEVQFSTYDFFIIIGSNRFRENDVLLAKEIKKMKKHYYFVRSKIDQDIQAERRKKDFNEVRVLSKIRHSCRENLKEIGNPEVFLISTFDLAKYDFQKLLNSLKDSLSECKWAALIQSLPVSSQFLQSAFMSFGLDDKSIQKLAKLVKTSEAELRSEMKFCFASGVNRTTIESMISTRAHNAKTVQAILTDTVPVGVAGKVFVTNIQLLHYGVNEMVKDAKALIDVTGLT
ncbi:hypothetical protein LDENG_00095290 [Lucifuga dentata]|nr:hypothetical protein LDENG_00095290 [Lucifuga dentata]